jgi:hypothetical protein
MRGNPVSSSAKLPDHCVWFLRIKAGENLLVNCMERRIDGAATAQTLPLGPPKPDLPLSADYGD